MARRALGASLFSSHDLEGGWWLGERYQVLEVLGRGAAGTVFRVKDPRVDREVALKLLDGSGLSSHGSERFLREVRILGALAHPGVVQVYDAGVHEGVPYYVLELASETLADTDLNLSDWVELLAQVARACGAAHSRGIVHRDLKPENVLLIGGHPKVADFGIAKTIVEGSLKGATTQDGTIVGTPQFMAPEQLGQGEVGPWTDVHALGVMLYERLTGSLPYAHTEGLVGLCATVLSEERPDPGKLAPRAPSALQSITRRALALAPEDRFANGDEFAAALEKWLASARSGRVSGWTLGLLITTAALVLSALLFDFTGRATDVALSSPVVSPSNMEAQTPQPEAQTPQPEAQTPQPEAQTPQPRDTPSEVQRLAPNDAPLLPADIERFTEGLPGSAAGLPVLSEGLCRELLRRLRPDQPLRKKSPEFEAPIAGLEQRLGDLAVSPDREAALAIVRLVRVCLITWDKDELRSLRANFSALVREQPTRAAAAGYLCLSLVGYRGSSESQYPRVATRGRARYGKYFEDAFVRAREAGFSESELEEYRQVLESYR